MLLILPHDCSASTTPAPPARHRPWLVGTLLALAIVVRLLESLFVHLPGWLQEIATLVAWWRLYSDPGDQLFSWWQLWSHSLVSDGWVGLLVGGVLFWALAAPLERRLGSLALGLGLACAVPLGAAVFILAGEASPDLGLVLPVLAVAGLALGLDEHVRVRWLVVWWLLRHCGLARFTVPLVPVLVAFVLVEFLRLGGPALLAQDSGWLRYLPIHLLACSAALIGGHLIARLGWQAATASEGAG